MRLSMRGRSVLLLALTLLARTLALQQLDILSAAPTVYTYFQGHPIANNPALFGSPPYGSSITGRLLYAQNAHFACTNFSSTDVPNWPAAPADPSQPAPAVILLVDRGGSTASDPCTFVEKVFYGQQAGAAAVVVVNTEGDALPFMKSDGSALSTQITIPAMIIGFDDGQMLEAEAVKTGVSDQVMARLRWGLPHPDDHVEWSLWLTPTNLEAKSFLTALSSVSDALGKDASFVPQYFLKKAGCPSGLSFAYCSYDPLPDGIDDDAVIEETVRQLCVFQVSNQTGQVGAWWRYMSLFYKQCYSSFSKDCSKQVLNTLWISAAAVDKCVADSWNGQANSLLDQQFAQKAALGAWISPTLFINSEPFAGSLYCGGTVKQSNCSPLRALCAGFFEDSRPAMCDCEVLGAIRDECGVCGGNNGCKAAGPEASGGMSWSTLAIIAVVVAAVGGIVFFAYTRRQRRLARLEIDEILRRYVPLGEDGSSKPSTSSSSSAAGGAATGSGGGRHEFGEEDDEEEHITHLTAGIGSALRSDSSEPIHPAKPAPPPSAGAVAAAAPRSAFAIDDHEEDGEQEV